MTLDEAIDAFSDGLVDFAQFRAVIEDNLARNPELMESALLRLDQLKQAGRLSTALHALMAEEIDRSSSGDITPPFGEDEVEVEAPVRREATHGEAARSKAIRGEAAGSKTTRGETAAIRATREQAPATVAAPYISPAPRVSPVEKVTRAAPARPTPIRAESPPDIGTVLGGRYRLEAPLGRGGMSLVYRAEDLHRGASGTAGAKVAVKLLAPDHVGRVARQALEREAALLGELFHPGVVRMLDFGQHGENAYLVMELLIGERLRNRLARSGPGALPADEATRIVRQLADALAYLHRRGLVHRDVKPANIFITASGDIRLLDFGLAGPAGNHESPASPVPRTWTPLYASPETLKGVPPDFRDDVYSLGCVVYEMIAGRQPWGKLPADEAVHRKLKLARPAGLPGFRWKVLRQALSFRAADRPPDAAAFRAAYFATPRTSRYLPWAVAAVLAAVAAGIAINSFISGSPRESTMPPAVVAPPLEWLAGDDEPDAPATSDDPVAVDPPAITAGEPEPEAAPAEAPSRADAAPERRDAPAEDEAAEAVPEPSVEAEPASPPPDADPAPPALALAASSFRVMESGGALRLEMARPANVTGPLRVRWRTLDQTARDGVDFAGSPAWQYAEASSEAPSLVILIPIVDNSLPGRDRIFWVELEQVPQGPPVGTPARAQVTIVDDD